MLLHVTQEKTIPHLKVLKRIPGSTLIQEGVVQEENVYDFHGWYCSLVMKKSMFDHAKQEHMEMEGSIQEIQSKILASIEELLGHDVHASSNLNLEELKEKMKFIYFKQLKSIRKNQLDDLVFLTIHINNLQKHMRDCESIFNACSDALDVIDLQPEGLPNVTMEKLNSVLARFIEYATRERDASRNLLEDSLLDD